MPAKRFDHTKLFTARRPPPGAYASDDAELDAVAAGTKALFYLPIATEVSAFASLYAGAMRRGLTVVLEPDDDHSSHLFVLPHGEMWRVPAFVTLWKTAFVDGTWSNAAEIQMSMLLGYPEPACRAWLAYRRYNIAAWGARTMLGLADAEAARAIEASGRRLVPAGLALFDGGDRDLRADAAKRIPKGFTLVRVAIDRDGVLRSNVQVLRGAAWA